VTVAPEPPAIPRRQPVEEFRAIGIEAFTTTRADGDYGLGEGDPPAPALARWAALQASLAPAAPRLASARQVHGTRVLEHGAGWDGWRRFDGADGHLSLGGGLALAVTIADCVPVFLAHPGSGAVGLLHAGWRGTAGRIVPKALAVLARSGFAATDIQVHLGPAICGRCYEVGPDVFEQLTGWSTIRNRHVDLRALLAEQAKEAGVTRVSASPYCTRCDNDRFYSHRSGDAGRQVAVVLSTPP
jgi:YfiH family protein